jgi:hypothetical protein
VGGADVVGIFPAVAAIDLARRGVGGFWDDDVAPVRFVRLVAVRAADLEAALVAGEHLGLDARGALRGGGAADEDEVVGVGFGALFGHLDGVALAADVGGGVVGLFDDDDARGGGFDVAGGVGADELEQAAGVGLAGAAVATRARLERDPFAQRGRAADHGLELFVGEVLCAGDAREDGDLDGRLVGDVVADDVADDAGGVADLRGLLAADLADVGLAGGGKDAAQDGGGIETEAARDGGLLFGELALGLGPVADVEVRRGREVGPGAGEHVAGHAGVPAEVVVKRQHRSRRRRGLRRRARPFATRRGGAGTRRRSPPGGRCVGRGARLP